MSNPKLFVFLTDITSNEYHIWHEKIEMVDDSCFIEVKAIAGKWQCETQKICVSINLENSPFKLLFYFFSSFFLTFFRTSNKDVIIVRRPTRSPNEQARLAKAVVEQKNIAPYE